MTPQLVGNGWVGVIERRLGRELDISPEHHPYQLRMIDDPAPILFWVNVPLYQCGRVNHYLADLTHQLDFRAFEPDLYLREWGLELPVGMTRGKMVHKDTISWNKPTCHLCMEKI